MKTNYKRFLSIHSMTAQYEKSPVTKKFWNEEHLLCVQTQEKRVEGENEKKRKKH